MVGIRSKAETLRFDEVGHAVAIVIFGETEENMTVSVVIVHAVDLLHKLAGFLADFGVEIGDGAEDEGAVFLSAGAVSLKFFVASSVEIEVDVAGTAASGSRRIIPNRDAKHLLFGAVGAGFAATVPEISTPDVGGAGESLLDEPFGDVEGGARAFDLVDNENVFAIERGGRMHNSLGVFGLDTFR